MKGTGKREERETTITINEKDPTADIWTASELWYRKLKKLGHEPVEDRERSACFKVPKKCVNIRKPRVLTKKQKADLTKRAVFMRNTLINSRQKTPNSFEQGVGSHKARSSQDSLKPQGQNGEKGHFGKTHEGNGQFK